jgi:hypothetical protein
MAKPSFPNGGTLYNCAGAASSGDIDMLLGHPDYTSGSKSKPPYIKSIVSAMEEDGFVTETLSAGESKFMVKVLIVLPMW